MGIYIDVCVKVCIYVCVYIYVYVHVCIHIHMSVHIHVDVSIYVLGMCTCMCVYVWASLNVVEILKTGVEPLLFLIRISCGFLTSKATQTHAARWLVTSKPLPFLKNASVHFLNLPTHLSSLPLGF